MRLWRARRSAGVAVSPAVHQLIQQGNAARDRHDWATAQSSYHSVVIDRPDLVHIWVQLGHALKEDGQWRAAEQAYRKGLLGAPADADAILSLGHVLKLLGDRPAAADCFVQLACADRRNAEAMREAKEVAGRLEPAARRYQVERLIAASFPDESLAISEGAVDDCRLVFDVSDLISYFSHSRRPTGIQRVQIEIVLHASNADSAGTATGISFCCFIEGRDEWVVVPPQLLVQAARLGLSGGTADDSEWHDARDRLHLSLLAAPTAEFAIGATLINLGTSWWLQNYFLSLRDIRRRRAVNYIPMIHDVIPASHPHLCLDELVRDFNTWAYGVFFHADRFIANSEATKRDFLASAERLGAPLPANNIAVVALDGCPDATMPKGGPKPAAEAGDFGPFVLFVATFEPRKGHLIAFDAWERLAADMGVDRVPLLVCVGRSGWRNEEIRRKLEESLLLRHKVRILSNLSDGELAELYDRCLFTIYPSLYEGWGLRVTEALCHGKAVITTNVSSLPEAGGRHAIYVDPGSAEMLAHEVAALALDPIRLGAVEAEIARAFHPRSWHDIASQMCAAASRLGSAVADGANARLAVPMLAKDQSFHWISRSMGLELKPSVDNGERYRSGTWRTPEPWGCRVSPNGSELAFAVPSHVADGTPLTVVVRLIGDDDLACPYEVKTETETVAGSRAPLEQLSVGCAAIVIDGAVRATVVGTAEPPTTGGSAEPRRTVGVAGFAFTIGDVKQASKERSSSHR